MTIMIQTTTAITSRTMRTIVTARPITSPVLDDDDGLLVGAAVAVDTVE